MCREITASVSGAELTPIGCDSEPSLRDALSGAAAVIGAGAAGAELASESVLRGASDLRVAVDLNAVPPPGLGGVDATDKAREVDGVVQYGAIGVGATKMKIHKAALKQILMSNDRVLDAEEIYELAGVTLVAPK